MEAEPELFKRARECKFFQGALLELAEELPASDEGLDELLTLAVAKRENEAFTRLLLAALGAQRKVDARHLHDGAALLPDPGQLTAVSMHLSGDVASALIRAVEGGKMGNEREAMALLLAAVWCKEKADQPIPPELVAQARTLGRTYYSDFLPTDSPSRFLVTSALWALANLIREETLLAVLDMKQFLDRDPFLEQFKGSVLRAVKDSALGLVPERPGPVVHSGFTLRRSVPRVGRNDPCPCGSGKKYKKCCIEKDKERLQESSSVPGLTKEELRERKEQFLTRDALLTMRSYELARLDPLKVSDSLKPILINRLHAFQEYETVVEIFEKIGVPEALEGHWDDAVYNVARASNPDLLERLLKIRQAQGDDPSEIELPMAAVFLRMSREPNPALELLEKTALDGIKQSEATRNFSLILDLAYCLLDNRYPALGILAARSVLPIGNVFDVEILFDSLLKARDKLNLSPVDPLQSIVDERFYESIDEHRDSEELKAALKHLKDKDRQLSTLRAEVEKLHSELEGKEREMRKAAETAPPQTPAPRPSDERDRLEKLRERSASLKTELKERHEERNELRRELQSAMKALETMRRKAKSSDEPIENAADNAGRSEEHLLLAEEAFGVQPIRTPVFPKKFLESVKPLPEAVVRNAVALIGKLAAGDETAFLGTKRLKSDRDLYRQRIGSEHRLLFRLHSAQLEVVALINRRDLERKIKRLC